MTRDSQIRERGISFVIITILFLSLGMHSFVAKAQESKTAPGEIEGESQRSASGKSIRVAVNSNKEAIAEPMHASLNSPAAELKPTLSPDGRRLYFSRSNYPNSSFAGASDKEDVWYSNFDKITDTWSDPIRMSGVINNDGPNFINNVSMTGDTIILGNQYMKKGKMRAGLSYSVNVNGDWSAPVNIDILNDYNMSPHANAFVSLRNGVIIEAVQRGETFGSRDLYVSFWDGVHATEPVNMGGVINTNLEESSPFLAADNKTLYFASKGHAGYGGYDIFVTTRLDESWANWSEPMNLGTAVNGTMDDEFFSLSHGGRYATFSKEVSEGNADLFKISTDNLFTQPADKGNKQIKEKDNTSFASL